MELNDVAVFFLNRADKLKGEISFLLNEEQVYSGAIDDLEKGILSKRSQKLLYDKYRIYITKGNYKKMLSTLKTDLFVIKEKLNIINRKKDMSLAIYDALKYHQVLEPNLMTYLREELEKALVADVEIMKINEKIKIHNSKVKDNRKNTLKSDDLTLILEMLNHGFEYLPKENPAKKEELDLIIAQLNDLIDNDALSIIKDSLNLEDAYQTMYNKEEIKYLFTEILRHCQDRLFDLIQVLKNKEYYYDIESLQMIKTEYKVLNEKIIFLRDKLDSLTLDKDEEISLESNSINKLYYSSNSKDPNRCYFMKDIASIREESLGRIEELLTMFKNKDDTLTIKALRNNDKMKSFIEIKEDQIRIILKPINNHLYSLMGVFIKKSDNLKEVYKKICSRPIAEIDDEFSILVEETFKDYVKENARKGSR